MDLCFFHIEKCMGTSINMILYEYLVNIYSDSEIYKNYIVNSNNLIDTTDLEKIRDKKVLLCHMSFNKENVTDIFSLNCYSIICLREPIDRIISHYYYFDIIDNKKLYELSEEELMTYLTFYGNVMTWRLSGETANSDIALENIKYVKCILLFETIEEDLKILNNVLNIKYGINNTFNIKHENKGSRSFDEKDIECLNKYKHLIIDYTIYDYVLSIKNTERIKQFI